jgi:hypothetical protein
MPWVGMGNDEQYIGEGGSMKRKGLWLSGLALAALLALAPDAHAGGWIGHRAFPPFHRHAVVIGYPGRTWVGGYRDWDRVRYHWLPGGWVARRHPRVWVSSDWGYRHYGPWYRGGYRPVR